MAAAVPVVSAKVGVGVLLQPRMVAARGSGTQSLSGRSYPGAPYPLRHHQRSMARQIHVRAGETATHVEEGGETKSRSQMVVVHVRDEIYTFRSDKPVSDIVQRLEGLAGKGVLVRAADHFVPLPDDQVPAGDYIFKPHPNSSGSTGDHAELMAGLAALNERMEKLETDEPSSRERGRNWLIFWGYVSAAWAPPAFKVVGSITKRDLEWCAALFDAMKDTLSPFVVVDRLLKCIEGKTIIHQEHVEGDLDIEHEKHKQLADAAISFEMRKEEKKLRMKKSILIEENVEETGFLVALRYLHCD